MTVFEREYQKLIDKKSNLERRIEEINSEKIAIENQIIGLDFALNEFKTNIDCGPKVELNNDPEIYGYTIAFLN